VPVVLFALLVAASACAVGPDYATPDPANQPMPLSSVDMPDAEAAGVASGRPIVSDWWTTFKDAELDSLVARLVDQNLDVRTAMARVREARALRGVSESALYPQLTFNGQVGDQGRGDKFHSSITYLVGFDAQWELDVFGGIRRGVEAAGAALEASIEGRRAALVSLLGELGLNYVELRTNQRQLDIAKRNVSLQEKTLGLVTIRRNAKIASDLEVAQAARLVESTRASVPALEQAIAKNIFRLSVLVGQVPSALLDELGKPAPVPSVPPTIPVGLGSELLLRRPDIRQAERNMHAACANVGVAEAALYPQFSLTGNIGYASAGGLNAGTPQFYVGPAVTWPIFSGFKIVENIKATDARLEQAVLAYRQAILLALEDVENSVTAYAKETVRRETLGKAALEAEKAERLAQVQYKNGLVDFLNVVDAEGTLAAAQQQLVQSEQTLLTDLIAVYKSLGGGWDVFDVHLAEHEVQPSDTELPR